ncbi:MAG: PqqD family protein [Myxococcota bacterium]
MADSPHLQILPTLAWDQFPDEIVAIDLERGVYFNLAAGGAETFQAFATATTVDEAIERLAPRFDAPRAALAAAVRTLVDELRAEGLLVVVDAPTLLAPAAPLPPPAARRPLEGFSVQKHQDIHELLVIDPVHQVAEAGWPAKKT